ncbi:hypothetical protein [Mesorhizobium metallidurans]|nr:hypothetical protein [Mesorhizobium metallidurans]
MQAKKRKDRQHDNNQTDKIDDAVHGANSSSLSNLPSRYLFRREFKFESFFQTVPRPGFRAVRHHAEVTGSFSAHPKSEHRPAARNSPYAIPSTPGGDAEVVVLDASSHSYVAGFDPVAIDRSAQ